MYKKTEKMKLDIQENSISIEDLKSKLAEKFPQYKISLRNKMLINVAKTNTIGCVVMVHKKKLIINGNFPTMGASIAFSVFLVLLGILIPLIIYFAVFHKKMKAVEKEVLDFVKQEYNLS